MSFYPTVDKHGVPQIKALDGWLVDILTRSYEKRSKILESIGLTASPIPRDELITGAWYVFPNVRVETKLPSFFLAWRYIRKLSELYGLEKFPSSAYEYL
jgi:hypothetical protein